MHQTSGESRQHNRTSLRKSVHRGYPSRPRVTIDLTDERRGSRTTSFRLLDYEGQLVRLGLNLHQFTGMAVEPPPSIGRGLEFELSHWSQTLPAIANLGYA